MSDNHEPWNKSCRPMQISWLLMLFVWDVCFPAAVRNEIALTSGKKVFWPEIGATREKQAMKMECMPHCLHNNVGKRSWLPSFQLDVIAQRAQVYIQTSNLRSATAVTIWSRSRCGSSGYKRRRRLRRVSWWLLGMRRRSRSPTSYMQSFHPDQEQNLPPTLPPRCPFPLSYPTFKTSDSSNKSHAPSPHSTPPSQSLWDEEKNISLP